MNLSETLINLRPPPLPVRVCLYRIFREAMTNVIRHARADAVRALLSYREGMIILEIADNGAGFEREKVEEGHYGLKNMEKRVDELGGALAIETEPSQGTRIKVELPLG